jgi:hypothetical protein
LIEGVTGDAAAAPAEEVHEVPAELKGPPYHLPEAGKSEERSCVACSVCITTASCS